MALDSNELAIVKAINIIYLACFILNFLFAVHNITRYIIGLKMKKWLILLFYTLLLVHNSLRVAEYCFRIA